MRSGVCSPPPPKRMYVPESCNGNFNHSSRWKSCDSCHKNNKICYFNQKCQYNWNVFILSIQCAAALTGLNRLSACTHSGSSIAFSLSLPVTVSVHGFSGGGSGAGSTSSILTFRSGITGPRLTTGGYQVRSSFSTLYSISHTCSSCRAMWLRFGSDSACTIR